MIQEIQNDEASTSSAPTQSRMRINDHFQVIEVSDDILELTGWTSRDLTGHLIQELIHPSDKAQMQVLLADKPSGALDGASATARLQHAIHGWTLVRFEMSSGLDTDPEGKVLLLSQTRDMPKAASPPIPTEPADLTSLKSLLEHQGLCIIFDSDLNFVWANADMHQTFETLQESAEPFSEAQLFDRYDFRAGSKRLGSPPLLIDPTTGRWQGTVSVSLSGKTQHFQLQRKTWLSHGAEIDYVVLLLQPIEVAAEQGSSETETSFTAIRLIAHEFGNILSVIGGHASLLSAKPNHLNHHSIEQLDQYTQQAIVLLESLSLLGHLDDHQIDVFSPIQHIKELEPILQLATRKRLSFESHDHISGFECQGVAAHFDLALIQSAQACQVLLAESGRIHIKVATGDGLLEIELVLTEIDAQKVAGKPLDTANHRITEQSVREHFESLSTLADAYHSDLRFKLEGQTLTLALSLPGQQLPNKALAQPDVPVRVIKQALLIEDDLGVSDLVSLFLGSLGLDVTSCASEQDVAALTNYDFDIIVSDVMLTGSKTGPDLVRDIRRDNPGIACLFISGYKHGALSQSDLEHPKTDFLAKPFSKQDFTNRVEALMAASDPN
ncbi:MAG: response regulator [Pseudomonadales bacterium]